MFAGTTYTSVNERYQTNANKTQTRRNASMENFFTSVDLLADAGKSPEMLKL